MIRIGITGNIGSGKSTVTKVFAALGIPVYYADLHASQLMNSHSFIKKELIKLFGDNIYNEGGLLNKQMLGELIFSNDVSRRNVNAIVHPIVAQHFEEWFSYQDAPYVLKEAALLFESSSNLLLDKVICVAAPLEMRIDRVMLRDKRSREQIVAIESKQMSEVEKIKKSDYIIYNNNSQPVIPQVLNIHQKIISRGNDLINNNI
jgi:dephospho-CoA kinase